MRAGHGATGVLTKAVRSLRWLPAYAAQRLLRRPQRSEPVQLMIAVADHFEPAIVPEAPGTYAGQDEQERRVERWCREYPKLAEMWRDSDGHPLRHTYFYPAEQYEKSLISRLAEHCQAGWGEIEIQLHHGVDSPDTAENTRRVILEFRDALAWHGCLSRLDGIGQPRYAFVHGNWALANSARGHFCGVDNEMEMLAETGCYADLTLPSAPSPAQISKINALYECALPLSRRAPHRRGNDLRCGRLPRVFPLIVQGPLGVRLVGRGRSGLPLPRIENGELTAANPPTMERLRLWLRTGIAVRGRPDWLFVKLHCHGMDPRDEPALLGEPMRWFLRDLTQGARNNDHRVHFVTAREMVNIVLAACDGRDGDPGQYRDYRLRLITPGRGNP